LGVLQQACFLSDKLSGDNAKHRDYHAQFWSVPERLPRLIRSYGSNRCLGDQSLKLAARRRGMVGNHFAGALFKRG
jgi:hypothetical protein